MLFYNKRFFVRRGELVSTGTMPTIIRREIIPPTGVL
jgi:hypothetical protein